MSEKGTCLSKREYGNYKDRRITDLATYGVMKIKIALCLLSLALLPACTTTQSTAQHETLEQRLTNKYAGTDMTAEGEPAPPAEGPEDIPAEGPQDPERNPKLLPTPLLRYWASSRTP